MRRYKWLKNIKKYGIKKGMIVEWNKLEQCYTTNKLAWFSTPLLSKEEVNDLFKMGYLAKEIKN